MFKKFSFIFAGFIIILFILELGFRGWSFFYKENFNKDFILESSNQHFNRVYTIFTIGESTTAVSADESKNFLVQNTAYPVYLLEELSKKYPHIKFKIHNLGVMGGASDSVIYRLLEELSKTKPDLIISMVGMKDYQYTPRAFQEKDKDSTNFLSTILLYFKSLNWVSNVFFELSNKSRWIKKNEALKSSNQLPLPPGITILTINQALTFLGEEFNNQFTDTQLKNHFDFYFKFSEYINNGQYLLAQNLASESIKNTSIGHIPLYYLQIRENKKSSAISTLENFIKLKPNNSFAIAKLISLYSLDWDQVKINNFIEKLKQKKLDIDYYPIDYEIAKFLSSKNKYEEAIKKLLPYSERFSISKNKSRQDITLFDNKSKKPFFKFNEVKNSTYAKNYFQVELATNYQNLLSENYKKVSNFKKYQEHLNYYLYLGKGSMLPLYLIKKRLQKENAPNFKQDQFSLFLDENYHFSDFYDLANFYLRSGQSYQVNRSYKLMKKKLASTVYNYNYIYQIAKKNNIKIAFMQYPGFSVDLLRQFINKNDVYLISNENVFGQPPKSEYIYETTYPYSTPYKYYHYTIEGAKLIAKNVAQQLGANILNFP